VATETSSSTDSFVDDVRASFAAWRIAPGLPIVVVVLTVVSSLTATPGRNALILVAGLAVAILNLGWLGTQLVWYQRVFDRRRMDPRELVALTWKFVARYLALVCIPAALVGIALVPIAIRMHSFPDLKSAGGRAGLLALIAVLVILSTFIFPALAYTTRRVTKAIPIGFAMLIDGWPRNALYLLVPSATAAALGAIGWLFPSTAQAALGILGALIYLAYAGAIARYYLRHIPSPPRGEGRGEGLK